MLVFVAKDIPKILAGSAMAGFGFSVGRDVYKGTKNPSSDGIIIFLLFAVLFVAFLSVYNCMIWIFRNYQNAFKATVIRILSFFLFLPGLAISKFTIGFVITVVLGLFGFRAPEFENNHAVLLTSTLLVNFYQVLIFPLYLLLSEPFSFISQDNTLNFLAGLGGADSDQGETGSFLLAFLLSSVVVLFLATLGAVKGLKQRKKRRDAWNAQVHNIRFLDDVGLTEIAEGEFRDRDGNTYRLEKTYADRLELFAIGRRNKRGYLLFDEKGNFNKWTGMVTLN